MKEMKRKMKISAVLLASCLTLTVVSCKKKGCTDEKATNYNDKAKKDDGSCTYATPTPEGTIELTGDLESQTLTSDKKYLLKGQVFVRAGKTLTIQPGTVVFGDKATKGTLIIDKGGKLIANGEMNNPIVFTSALPAGQRDKGDWGGLVILGLANQNQPNPAVEGITPAAFFGGTNDSDDSGSLKYVRVEFAGIELTPNNETNSITLGAVGNQTEFENVMVSFGGDDGFEWFGGSINGKNLISFGCWDDDFDVDYGFTGKNQFALAVRYASFADQSGSNIFETDNGPNDDITTLLTTGAFSNVTGIGPKLTNSQSTNANYQHAIDLRRRTALSIGNSVFVGMPRGIRMNQNSVYSNYTNGTGVLTNNILCVPTNTYLAGTGTTHTATDVETYWTSNGNTLDNSTDFAVVLTSLGINPNVFFGANTNTGYSTNPTFAVTSGALTSGASFTNPKFSTGFQQVSYRGAFGATNWTSGWAEWNPIAKQY